VILTWNAAAERLYGFAEEEAVGRHVSLIVPPDRMAELDEIMRKVAVGSVVQRLETVRVRKDGAPVEVVLTVWPLMNRHGEIVGATSVARDITDRARFDREREEAEVRFQAAFRRSAVGMVVADLDGRPTAVNPAICRMMGRQAEDLLGRDWAGYLHPEERSRGPALVSVLTSASESYSCERRYQRPDGSEVSLQIDSTVVRSASGAPIYLMAQMQDVTARKRMEVELHHRALHDELTGLANRALLKDRLEHALAASARNAQSVGVAFVDLDGFKHVNDVLGHAVGDQLLREVARRPLEAVRPADTVGRFGGDEFVVVAENVGVDALVGVADRITEQMNEPFWFNGSDVGVQVSIGLTVSRPGSTSQSLLSEADAAMYRAKELGRARSVVFDDSLRVRAAASLRGERLLRQAVARKEVVPYYQPIVDLRSGEVVGVEALARWRMSDGQIVPPAGFIPLAESTGLIVPIGEAILAQSVEDVAVWNDLADKPIWVSVNLSTRQIADANLPRFVERILAEGRIFADRLHLEITETAVMEDMVQSVAVLQKLKELGVRLSIDDFGTGYSSLAYLQQLPVDTLKIDRSFVRGLGSAEDDTAIVAAIIAMGRALGMNCIAEGVETRDQSLSLAAMGCQYGQGFLWSRPVSPEEAAAWVNPRR
jgi:diguanylate cyclase (GGDEF)-like protein/PAS domain S-box-containing protein